MTDPFSALGFTQEGSQNGKQDPFSSLGFSEENTSAPLGEKGDPALKSNNPRSQAYEKFMIGAGRGALDVGQGIKQAGITGLEKIGLKPKGSADKYTQDIQNEIDFYNTAPVGQSGIGAAARMAGNIGATSPAFLIPGVGQSALLRAVTQGVAQQGLTGGAQFVPEGGSRLKNIAIGGLMGGTTYPAARLIGSANPLIKSGAGAVTGGLIGYGIDGKEGAMVGAGIGAGTPFLFRKNLDKLAAKHMLDNVNPEQATATKQAAERLGLSHITPAEASGNTIAAAAQGALGTSKKGAQKLFEKGQERLTSERKAISNLFDTIHPRTEKMLSEEEALYKEAHKTAVSPNKFNTLTKDPVLTDIMAKMEKVPAYQKELEGLSPSNLKYLDYTKRSLDDMIETANRNGEKNLARLLGDSRKKLVSAMDDASSAYPKARELAQRRLTRDEFEKALNEKEMNGTNFYNKVLRNDNKFNGFMEKVKNIPEAQQKLKDMREVFRNLINPVTPKQAATAASTHVGNESFSKDISQHARKIATGKYDRAAIDLITSNKWDKEFSKIAKMKTGEEKNVRLGDLLAKIATTGAVQEQSQK